MFSLSLIQELKYQRPLTANILLQMDILSLNQPNLARASVGNMVGVIMWATRMLCLSLVGRPHHRGFKGRLPVFWCYLFTCQKAPTLFYIAFHAEFA